MWLLSACAARSPCEGVICAGGGLCAITDDGFAACLCGPGFTAMGAHCVEDPPCSDCTLPDPCSPNPCVALHRTACRVAGALAVCDCDPGFSPDGEACAQGPDWNCAAQHDQPEEDAAEPDECPALARAILPGVDRPRSILPAGDHDWFSFEVQKRRIYEFRVDAASTLLSVEVFDQAGLRLTFTSTSA